MYLKVNTAALSGDVDAQQQGFGLIFPPLCTQYYPQLSLDCINSLWITSGCSKTGTRYPGNQSEEYLSTWYSQNQRYEQSHLLSHKPC